MPSLTRVTLIDKSNKTSQARKMSAGLGHFAGATRLSEAKGPAGTVSEGNKKFGRAVGKAFGVPSTKAKRPGGK